jgi:hypothetical protein
MMLPFTVVSWIASGLYVPRPSTAPLPTFTFPFTTTAPPKKQLPVTVLEYVRPGIAPWSQV